MSFALLRNIVRKKMEYRGLIDPAAPDNWYPIKGEKLCVGAVVDFTNSTVNLKTQVNKSFFTPIDNKTHQIISYGVINDGAFKIHKFYLDDDKHILQMMTNGDKVVEGETKLVSFLTEVNPQDEDEWNLWLKGEADGYPLLTGPTLDWEGKTFKRTWAPTAPGAADAKSYVENVYATNKLGGSADRAYQQVMLFDRKLDTMSEMLYMSVIRHDNARWIEGRIAVEINRNDFVVM